MAIVLGAEGPGCRAGTRCAAPLGGCGIPIDADVDSLNVAAAAAVAFAVVVAPMSDCAMLAR